MHSAAKAGVRTVYGNSNGFEVKFGMHQGSALNPLIVMEALSREFRVALPWQLLYADGVRYLLPQPVVEASSVMKINDEELVAGTRGYVCGECGQNFIDKTSVYSHMLTRHMSKFYFKTSVNLYTEYVVILLS